MLQLEDAILLPKCDMFSDVKRCALSDNGKIFELTWYVCSTLMSRVCSFAGGEVVLPSADPSGCSFQSCSVIMTS